MLELHCFHPSRFEGRTETKKVDAAGEPNLAFHDPPAA
jgi:hypothetical protein